MLKIAFVNPMSVDNLALYDVSLLKSMLQDKSELLIRYYGNEDINADIPRAVNFKGIYRYRKYCTPVKGLSYLISQIKLISELIRFFPDIVHIQWPKIPILDNFVWRLLKWKLPSALFIHTSHNPLPHDAPPVSALCWKPFYRLMDGIIVHHRYSADALVRDFPVSVDKISVIPHGPLRFPVDRESLESRVQDIRLRIGGGQLPSKPIVMFLGYLRPYKGPDLFLEAVSGLGVRQLAHYVIVGSGRLPYRLKGEDVSHVTRVNEKFRLDDFLCYLNAADLIVMPYRSISQSGLLMTAVSEGVPVLVSDRGGMPDVVRRHNAGWILESTGIPSLRLSLKKLLLNPSVLYAARRSMDKATLRELAQEWDEIGSETTGFYKSIHDSAGKGGNSGI